MPRPLSKVVKDAVSKSQEKSFILWKGPSVDGITQSMLSFFLCCRERFRVRYILGLKPADTFSKAIEYGNMWHILEECLASPEHERRNGEEELKEYVKGLVKRYPLQQSEILKWYNVCIRQFPEYVSYWKKQGKAKKQTVPLFQEEKFSVPYRLRDGRTVLLRGKFDSVDWHKLSGIWLQENKTKADIDQESIQRQLTFDLQTMFYMVALRLYLADKAKNDSASIQHERYHLAGVRYNVVRRPLSGGKGSIRQHQPTKSNPSGESEEQFYSRLINDYIKPEPEYWFMRWEVPIAFSDIVRFESEFLDPILTQVCDWYEAVVAGSDELKKLHWRLPYGIYNPIAEGGTTDFDEYINSRSTVGLERTNVLFPELE